MNSVVVIDAVQQTVETRSIIYHMRTLCSVIE